MCKKLIIAVVLCIFCSINAAYACHVEVNCVNSNGDGDYTAYFNYIGDGNSHTYAIGNSNKFSPTPINRGQPTSFRGSRINEVFFLAFNTQIAWTLNGTTATAKSTSTQCTSHKVKICHIPPGNVGNAHTIDIDEHALAAHLSHGDAVGACTFDCMGVPLGHAVIDQCGVCGGDSSTCKDCAGVPNGTAEEDLCGVCNGDNSTCKDCAGTPNGQLVTDLCGICGGDNSTCKDCLGVPNGTAVIDLCGVCNGQSNTCLDCAGVPNGTSKLDQCGVCNGNGTSCLDCRGIPNGLNKLDQCGVCDANPENDNTTCVDCLGVINGTAQPDACGVCNGDGKSCADCAGVPNGPNRLDRCNVCDADTNNDNTTCLDCLGEPNGAAKLDLCGICNGDSSSCKDCAGIPNGLNKVDRCGVCDANTENDNTTCVDCLGIPNGGAHVDACGICNGTGSSCKDCAGIPNGPNMVDLCGVCDSSSDNNNQCMDCRGIPNGGTLVDKCGICGGDGGKLVKLKINKKKMKFAAKVMLYKKTLPYYAGAVKCDKGWAEKSKTQSRKATEVYRRLVETINALVTEVRLCPGECKDKINLVLLKRINKLVENLYWYASEAQHGARSACHATGPGVAGTRPIADGIKHDGSKCQTKACSKH